VSARVPEAPSSWHALARRAAHDRSAPTAGEAVRELLVFALDRSPYAVPVEHVREIVRVRPVTPIPGVEACVCGVISLRGEIIQVVDLRRRLGLAPAELGRASRIVVLHGHDTRAAGLLVDTVREVLRAPEAAIGPPVGGESGAVEALYADAGEFVSIVDIDRVPPTPAARSPWAASGWGTPTSPSTWLRCARSCAGSR
jgi:purine-binding chemotaxis protein CheW